MALEYHFSLTVAHFLKEFSIIVSTFRGVDAVFVFK